MKFESGPEVCETNLTQVMDLFLNCLSIKTTEYPQLNSYDSQVG